MKSRILTTLVLTAAAVLLSAVCGCMQRRERPLDAEVAFVRRGAEITFDRQVLLREITVSVADGGVVISRRYNEISQNKLLLNFDWKPGAKYLFRINAVSGILEKSLIAPAEGKNPASVELQVPYRGGFGETAAGTDLERRREVLVPAGGEITGAAIFTSYASSPVEFDCRITFPAGMEFRVDGAGDESGAAGESGLRIKKTLSVQNETEIETFIVKVDKPGKYEIASVINVKTGGKNLIYEREIVLNAAGRDEMTKNILLVDSALPTRMNGKRDERRRSDALYVRPEIFRRLGRYFGIEEEYSEPYVPEAYQSISLKSNAADPAVYMVESDILYKNRDETPKFFYPPDEYLGGRKDISVIVTATLMPGETATVVLPVFLADVPPSGEYRRRIRVIPMGAGEPVAEYTFPLRITSTNVAATFFTAAAVVVTALVCAFLAFGFGKLVASMKIRWIVIVALYGAMTFAVLNVPIRILGAVLSAISGPFGVFVTGIFSDILYLVLLVSLVRAIPRPGIITLTILIRYMLNGIFFGGIQISDILFTGTAIAAMEAAFFAAGVTRKKENFKWTAWNTAFTALCLSAANVFLILTNIYLFMALFRLFYAEWYIVMNVAINGILYTWIATYTGKRFSDKLKWTDV